MHKHLFRLLGILALLQMLPLELPVHADQSADFKRITSAISSGNALEAQGLIDEFLEKNPAGPLSLKAQYILGQLQYRKAAYREAAEIFSKILSEHPDWEYSDRTKYGLALAQIGMLDFSNASRTLESFLSTFLESELRPDALYWLGESLYRQRQYSAALGRFDRFLQLYPVHELREYALDSSAWCLEQLGRYSEASEERKSFLLEFKKSSLSTTARFCLAADLMETGERRLAAEQYLQAAGSTPASYLQKQALLRAGLLFADLGEPRKAVVVLEKAIRIIDEEELPLAREVLGNSYLKMTIYEKAKPIFEDLLREEKGYAPAERLELALALIGMENFDDASVILSGDGSLIENPAFEELRCLLLAHSLLELNMIYTAIERVNDFVSAMGTARTSQMLYTLAGILVLAGEFDRADEVLTILSKDDKFSSKNPEMYYFSALCKYKKENYSGSKTQLETFLKGKSKKLDDAPAQYLLAGTYLETGDLARSHALYLAFLEDWPDNHFAASALYRAGLLSLKLGKYEAAVSLLGQYIGKNPDNAASMTASYCVALAESRRGRQGEAINNLVPLLKNGAEASLKDRIILAYGLAEFERGNYENCDRILKEFTMRFPGSQLSDAAFFLAAASTYKKGAVAEAGAKFITFTGLFPTSDLAANAFLYGGLCEEKSNHPDTALVLYDRALNNQISKDVQTEICAARAPVQMAVGSPEAALSSLKSIADLPQESALGEYAAFWRARLLFSLARWDKAREELADFANDYPSSNLADDALFFAGRAARQQMDYTRAANLFQKLESLYPDSQFKERTTIEAAECMLEAGSAGAAANKFQEFIQQNVNSPLRPLALYDMGKALQRAGKLKEAIEEYKAAGGGETGELAARSHFSIAECLAELDRIDEAVAELVGMVRGPYPAGWAERAQLQIAQLLERDGQVEEARHIYVAAAKAYQNEAAGIVAERAIGRLNAEKAIAAQ